MLTGRRKVIPLIPPAAQETGISMELEPYPCQMHDWCLSTSFRTNKPEQTQPGDDLLEVLHRKNDYRGTIYITNLVYSFQRFIRDMDLPEDVKSKWQRCRACRHTWRELSALTDCNHTSIYLNGDPYSYPTYMVKTVRYYQSALRVALIKGTYHAGSIIGGDSHVALELPNQPALPQIQQEVIQREQELWYREIYETVCGTEKTDHKVIQYVIDRARTEYGCRYRYRSHWVIGNAFRAIARHAIAQPELSMWTWVPPS